MLILLSKCGNPLSAGAPLALLTLPPDKRSLLRVLLGRKCVGKQFLLGSLLKPPPLRLPLSSLLLPYGQDPDRRMDRKVDSPIEAGAVGAVGVAV